MQSQIQNYPDISFIGDLTLTQWIEQGEAWYIEQWKELTGEDIVLHDTDEERIMIHAIAMMFYQTLQYLDNAGKMNLLKYSMGDFLDNMAARSGIARIEAQPAQVSVKFILTEAQAEDYTIPEGTRVSGSALEDLYFAVDDDTVIPAGETEGVCLCTCTTAGTEGNNIAIGSIDELVDTLPYIDEVTNTTVSDGGTDIEDDDQLAERLFLAPSEYSTCGTEDSYIFHAKSASPLVNDVSVHSPEPCYLTITITSKTGMPSQELINIVTAYLNDPIRKKLTDRITVVGPDAVTFNINVEYWISYDNQKYEESIKAAVEQAVDDYVTWQTTKIGRNINPSKLYQLIMEAGANRCVVTYPEQTTVDSDELAVLGTKTVTYGGLEYE